MARRTIQDVFASERNADPFRMAILGFASLERALNDALADAFDGELPPQLRTTQFRVRLALAEALGLIPSELASPLGKLKKLRDDLAHGKLEEVDRSQAATLYAALGEIAPEIGEIVPGLSGEDAPIILSSLLIVLQEALLASFREAAARRATQQEALLEWWQRQKLAVRKLSAQEIQELLKEEGKQA